MTSASSTPLPTTADGGHDVHDAASWRVVWQLIKPYWFSEEKWRARGLLLSIIALALGMVYLNVLFNQWNLSFYNALQEKNYAEFKSQLWRFSYLAFIFIVVAIYRIYLEQALEMRWRAWLTRQYLDKWLAHQAYYHLEQNRSSDNPDQRIAEDLILLTRGSLGLSLGLMSSLVTLVSFIGILWTVSGAVSFTLAGKEWTVPGYMVWFALAYAGGGSLLVWWVGKSLIRQNFRQQRFEADFRFGLVRIREHAEAIALYRGENHESTHAAGRFERIRQNWWNIMRTTKRVNIVSTFYAQFANIFPFLVAAPRYFSGAIQLGGLMQIVSAFGHVQEALSWFINAFSASGPESLPTWKASANRLAGFHAAIEAAQAGPAGITVARNHVGAILLDRVALHMPNGQPLTQPFSGQIDAGQRILVSGPSGCGKSTLFRALAGIWPYGGGTIEIPDAASLLFVPQKSYLPTGTLRAVLVYPALESNYKDLAIRHYLEQCQLPHLCHQLDLEDNWSQRLSPGEQQRLAFVRVLLARPDVLMLDEATSALDADTEELLYATLLKELPEIALISIAHREAVAKFHQLQWQFTQMPGTGPTMGASAGFAIRCQKLAKTSP